MKKVNPPVLRKGQKCWKCKKIIKDEWCYNGHWWCKKCFDKNLDKVLENWITKVGK